MVFSLPLTRKSRPPSCNRHVYIKSCSSTSFPPTQRMLIGPDTAAVHVTFYLLAHTTCHFLLRSYFDIIGKFSTQVSRSQGSFCWSLERPPPPAGETPPRGSCYIPPPPPPLHRQDVCEKHIYTCSVFIKAVSLLDLKFISLSPVIYNARNNFILPNRGVGRGCGKVISTSTRYEGVDECNK